MKEFNKIIDARKYALDDKAVNWDYPRLFIKRPLPLPSNLPSHNYPAGFRSNRRKYNKLLDKAKEYGKFSIMNLGSFNSQNKNQLFNKNGSISDKGFEQFWIEISDTIKKDDDQTRIMANKLKAKQLAKSMEAELLLSSESDNEVNKPEIKDKPCTDKEAHPKKKKIAHKSPV